LLIPGIEHYPCPEEVDTRDRREALYCQILQNTHTVVSDIPPDRTVDPNATQGVIAIRDDTDNFGVKQFLFAVLKAGNHGFGIVSAYGKGIRQNGQSYLTHITEDPYVSRPRLVTPLFAGVDITIGGESRIVPELFSMDQHFRISANKKGRVGVQTGENHTSILQLITASNLPLERKRSEQNPLHNEVGTWSLPPGFVQSAFKDFA
jgi:hypothetical protein